MALPDPPPDPAYAQFLRWRDETAPAPPDPQAGPEAQQFHLFQQFLRFQAWQRAHEQRAPAPEPPPAARAALISTLQRYADRRLQQRPPPPRPARAQQPASSSMRRSCLVAGLALLGVLLCVVSFTMLLRVTEGPSNDPLPVARPSLPLAYEQYTDGSAVLHFIGVITNTTAAPVQDVVVHATLYDSKNRVDASETDYVGDVALAPGQRVGFDLRITSPPLKWVRADLQTEVRGGTFANVSGLRVGEDALAPRDGGGYIVRGVVHNAGPDDAYPATVLVTGYDERGRVVDVGDSDTTDRDGIDAGQSSPFEVNLWRRDVKIARYETLVYARGK